MHNIRHSYGKMDPDISKCQTSSVGAVIPGTRSEMYYCGIDYADCRFAMTFGFDLICKHPDNHTFLMPEHEEHEPSPARFPSNCRHLSN